MCTENYWMDIVETNHDPRGDTDGWWASRLERHKIQLGLKGDVPDWLIHRRLYNPPSNVKRQDRQDVRRAMTQTLRNAIAHGDDFEDIDMETRTSRLGDKRGWF